MNIYMTSNIRRINELMTMLRKKEKKIKFIVSHKNKTILNKIKTHDIKMLEEKHDNFHKDITTKHNINVIISNYAKETFDNLVDNCQINIICPVQTKKDLDILNNKFLIYNELKDKLILPKYSLIQNKEEFEEQIKDFSKNKICIKPVVSIYGIGFYKIVKTKKPKRQYKMSIDEYDTKLKGKQNLLMEYLPGFEYSCDTICDNGRLIVCFIRKKINDDLQQLVFNESIYKDIEYIVNKFNLHGTINLQFKEDINKIPNFLEVNPRISGGFYKSLVNHKFTNEMTNLYSNTYLKLLKNEYISDDEITKNKEFLKSTLKQQKIFLHDIPQKSF